MTTAVRRGQSSSASMGSCEPGAPGEQLAAQRRESGVVGFAPRRDHHVPRRHTPHELPPPHFLEPPSQTIAGHRGGLKLWYDQSHPRMARLILRPAYIEMRESPPPPRLLHPAKPRRAREPPGARQLLDFS